MQQDQTMELLRGIYSLWEGEELPAEIKDSVESEVGILIFQGVIATSSVLLTDEKNTELEKMFDDNKPMHAIVAFLENEIKDFDLLVKDVGSIVMNNLKESN